MREASAPPAALARSTGFLLSWVTASTSAAYEAAIAEIGLDSRRHAVLTLLADGPQKQARLSDQLAVFQPVMVHLVNDLAAGGLVERRPHPTDRRAVEVHLLPAGRVRLAEAERIAALIEPDALAPLDERERHTLHELLRRIASHPL